MYAEEPKAGFDDEATGHDRELRERAVQRLKKKKEFRTNLLAYVLINGFLVVIWAITSRGFFWPAFPMAGWGIGLVFHAWDVYGKQEPTEDEIQREIQHLR